jgi:hypothetical protein
MSSQSLSQQIDLDIDPFVNGKRVELILEIGVAQGGTTNIFCEKYLIETGGKVVCVDPLLDGIYVPSEPGSGGYHPEHHARWKKTFAKQYDHFVRNTFHNSNKIQLMRMTSSEAFPELLEKYEGKFDLIYIDGDHRSRAVWNDAINSFKLCKVGGYILFDDYLWKLPHMTLDQTPKPAVDRFISKYRNSIEVLKKGWRVMLRKVAE